MIHQMDLCISFIFCQETLDPTFPMMKLYFCPETGNFECQDKMFPQAIFIIYIWPNIHCKAFIQMHLEMFHAKRLLPEGRPYNDPIIGNFA